MEQCSPSPPDDSPAAPWLERHAGTLFAAIRRVVPDSLCAYDLGMELSALAGHRWDGFDGDRNGTRLAWASRLAAGLVEQAAECGAVPAGERHRNAAPPVLTLSEADLQRLSAMAHEPLDDAAGDARAAMERTAPSPAALARLRPSDLVRRSSSDVRHDGP